MAEQVTVDELAEAMFRMISGAQGVRKLKPNDVSKAMIEPLRPGAVQQGGLQGGHPPARGFRALHLHVLRRKLPRTAETGTGTLGRFHRLRAAAESGRVNGDDIAYRARDARPAQRLDAGGLVPTIELNGHTYAVDEDGFLDDPMIWNEQVAADLATSEGSPRWGRTTGSS